MTKKRVFHLSLCIEVGIQNAKSLCGCIEVDGRVLETEKEVKDFLRKQKEMGRKYLPMSQQCDNFDYLTGCQGHVIEEKS